MKNKRRLIVLLLTLSMVLSQMSLVAFADNEPAGEPEQTVTEQAAVETAFDQTVTENGVDITVKAAEGVFPAGAKLSAKKVNVPDAIDAENALAFDIKILVDGEEVQPKDNAKVEVSFKAAEVKKNETEVYHMDGSKADKLDVETKGTTATVETTGFSTYVLVFTAASAGVGTIDYSMGDKQTVALSTIVDNFEPATSYSVDSGTFEWNFLSAATESAKITVSGGKVSVNSSSTFDDGETAEVTIPYTYQSDGTKHSGSAIVKITFRNPDATGRIVEPTAVEDLEYSGGEQVLIEAGSTEFGVMQYKVGSTGWTDTAANIKGTAAKTYSVYWQVVLDDGTTIKSGSVLATISKKAATLTVRGGSKEYDGSKVELTDAANVKVTGMVNGEVLAETRDYILSTDKDEIKEIGEYEIDAATVSTSTILKNYDLTVVPGTYTITEKEASKMTVEVTTNNGSSAPDSFVKDFEWVYDGEKHGIVVTPKSGDTEITDATVYYSRSILNAGNVARKGDPNPENVYPTDAGSYPIYYYIIADGYQPFAGSETVTIDQAYLVATVESSEITYGELAVYQGQTWTQAYQTGTVTLKAYKEASTTSTQLDLVRSAISGLDKLAFYIDGYEGRMTNVGEYEVTLNALSSTNYDINYVAGTLTINPKVVDFDWLSVPDGRTRNFSWTYDGQEHGLTARIRDGQLVGTDAQTGQVEIVYESDRPNRYTNSATEVRRDRNWGVESYVAKVLKLDGPRGSNYTFYKTAQEARTEGGSFTSEQEFTIEPKELTLTPDPLAIKYGDDPSDDEYKGKQTFSYDGLVDGEEIDKVLLTAPTYWYGNYSPYPSNRKQYVAGDSDAGTYDIRIDNINNTNGQNRHNTTNGVHAQNYQVERELAANKLTVSPREVTLVWEDPDNLEYNGQYKIVSVTRAINDCERGSDPDHIAANSVLFKMNVKGTEAPLSPLQMRRINADTYTEEVEFEANARALTNYVIANDTNKHQWTITQRPATIYVNNNTITYGQAPADKGYYVDNNSLEYNEEKGAMDTIADKVELVPNYSRNGKPGRYAITAKLTNPNENYRIVAIEQGTLTVNDVKTVLNAKGTKSGKKGILVSWDGVSGAVSYDVYMSLCNTKKKTYTPVYVGSTSATSLKVKKIGKKKLKSNTPYKYYVVAKNSAGAPIAQSERGHFITNNVKGKKVNAKSMAVNTHSVTIAKGGAAGLSANYTKAKKGKKFKLLDGEHAPLTRFVSENPAVATVDANGVVYGVDTGWTRVYVIGVSGMWETVEVYVQ